MDKNEGIELSISSIVSHRTSAGMVNLKLGTQAVQMEVDQCREVAQWLLESAEAAETDAFLVKWLQTLGLPQGEAVGTLSLFRQEREEQRGIPMMRKTMLEHRSN